MKEYADMKDIGQETQVQPVETATGKKLASKDAMIDM